MKDDTGVSQKKKITIANYGKYVRKIRTDKVANTAITFYIRVNTNDILNNKICLKKVRIPEAIGYFKQ